MVWIVFVCVVSCTLWSLVTVFTTFVGLLRCPLTRFAQVVFGYLVLVGGSLLTVGAHMSIALGSIRASLLAADMWCLHFYG